LRTFFNEQPPLVPDSLRSDATSAACRIITGGELSASIAVYSCLSKAPLVSLVRAYDPSSLLMRLATDIHARILSTDSLIPHIAIQEVLENLIHASFSDVVISIMEAGHILRVADRGPGIPNKTQVLLPGFTTATQQMRLYIRGVGSGLPLTSALMASSGGRMFIEDNLSQGTVVTLCSNKKLYDCQAQWFIGEENSFRSVLETKDVPQYEHLVLSKRCKKVLSLALEYGEVGPSLLSKELKVSLSTAYRDLETLERLNLLTINKFNKRALTQKGITYIDRLFSE